MSNHYNANPEYDNEPVQFEIIERDDLSLADLKVMVEHGESVVRSPHVGNFSLYNCAVAATGATLVVYDRTVPDQDKNYFPGHHIRDKQAQLVIAKRDNRKLSTHIHTTAAIGDAPANTLLAEAQVSSIQAAMPSANVISMSRYLDNHRAAVNEVVRCLIEHGFVDDWERRVDEDGNLHKVTDPLAELERYAVFRDGTEATEQAGLLMPNSYNVLLFGILEALDYQTDTVTHLSGPDMINYIRLMGHDLAAMYRTVLEHTSLGEHLPRHLHFQIVPTAHARIVATSDKAEHVESLLKAYEQWSSATSERTPGWEERARLGRIAIERSIGQYNNPVTPARSTNYVTHNDVLTARQKHGGTGLHIPEAVWHMTFAEQGIILDTIRRLL